MISAVLLSLCLSGSVMPQQAHLEGPTINLLVGHHFSRGDAHARVQMLLDYWKRRYDVNQTWNGDNVTVSGVVVGVPFRAIIEISEDSVRCVSSDPGMFLRGSARDYVQKKLRKYLHPQYAEQ